MAGKFEPYQDKADEYRFRLKAGNGEVIATSEWLLVKGERQERHRVSQDERTRRANRGGLIRAGVEKI